MKMSQQQVAEFVQDSYWITINLWQIDNILVQEDDVLAEDDKVERTEFGYLFF